jgi:hypothetical protein
MGGFSRSKGRRGEYLVRNYFRELGYESERVPGSGAFSYRAGKDSLKGDIQILKNGEPLFKVEVKYQENVFDTIYKLYYANRDHNGTLRFALDGAMVAVGNHFPDIVSASGAYFHDVTALTYKDRRTYVKIANLKKLLGECQYLAIKRNNGCILFLKFWKA